MSAIAALAELGRVLRTKAVNDFAESKTSGNRIEDPDILGDLLDLLSQEIGRIDKVADVGFNPDTDTFKGKAEQRIGLGRSQVYQFDLSPDGMNYKMINAADMAEFADSDEGFLEILDYAAKGGKKLNCKTGNMQCGGKCQNGTKNCYHGMSPEQKKEAQSLAAKAKKAIGSPDAAKAKDALVKSKPVAKAVEPTSFKELDEKTQQWAKERGYNVIEEHDHTHSVLHRLIGEDSESIVKPADPKSNGPGATEEGMVVALQGLATGKISQEQFKDRLIKLATSYARMDKSGNPFYSDPANFSSQVSEYADRILSNPYLDGYLGQIRKMNDGDFDFAEKNAPKSLVDEISQSFDWELLKGLSQPNGISLLKSFVIGLGTIRRDNDLRSQAATIAESAYKAR